MIDAIERVRRLSVHDDWPACEFCEQPFTAGFTFYTDEGHHRLTFSVCDECLNKAKSNDVGWLK